MQLATDDISSKTSCNHIDSFSLPLPPMTNFTYICPDQASRTFCQRMWSCQPPFLDGTVLHNQAGNEESSGCVTKPSFTSASKPKFISVKLPVARKRQIPDSHASTRSRSLQKSMLSIKRMSVALL